MSISPGTSSTWRSSAARRRPSQRPWPPDRLSSRDHQGHLWAYQRASKYTRPGSVPWPSKQSVRSAPSLGLFWGTSSFLSDYFLTLPSWPIGSAYDSFYVASITTALLILLVLIEYSRRPMLLLIIYPCQRADNICLLHT